MENKSKANEINYAHPRPEPPNWPYHNPTPGEFPIMASDPRPAPEDSKDIVPVNNKITVTKEDYDRLKECGFNIVRYAPRCWTEQSISSA